jgi:hypothetical protein
VTDSIKIHVLLKDAVARWAVVRGTDEEGIKRQLARYASSTEPVGYLRDEVLPDEPNAPMEVGYPQILAEFAGFLSTHPDLHVVTEEGLLRNLPERAFALVDEFLEKRAEQEASQKVLAQNEPDGNGRDGCATALVDVFMEIIRSPSGGSLTITGTSKRAEQEAWRKKWEEEWAWRKEWEEECDA